MPRKKVSRTENQTRLSRERRKAPRFPLCAPAKLLWKNASGGWQWGAGVTHEVGMSALRVCGDLRPPLMSVVRCHVLLPWKLDDTKLTVSLMASGRVIRTAEVPDGGSVLVLDSRKTIVLDHESGEAEWGRLLARHKAQRISC